MTWFKRQNGAIGMEAAADRAAAAVPDTRRTATVRTEGLWVKCAECGKPIFRAELETNAQVCPHCGYHFKLDARGRIALLLEPGFELVDLELRSTDPLEFCDLKPYKRRLAEAQKKTGLNDAIVNATGFIGPHPVVISAMEYGFIGGSMGAVVGETIARAVDRARESGTR